jgi:hypothetical protein
MPADCDLTRILEQARTAVDDCPEALGARPDRHRGRAFVAR